MKTRLIFVRHGFSEANQGKIFAGQTEAPLTKTGHLQAKAAAEYLSDIQIDSIFSSTLSRAYETGLAIAEKKGLSIIPDQNLVEINGGRWENTPFANLAEISPEAYDFWMNDLYSCKCPDGESIKDFFDRIHNAVLDIAKKCQGKTICIATHATPIRVISCLALGYRPKDIQNVPWTPNASINIIDFEDGKFEFVKRDITEHLKGIETSLPSNV